MRTTYTSGWGPFKQDHVLTTDLTQNGYCNTPENPNPSSGAYHGCDVGFDCDDCRGLISTPPPPSPSPPPPFWRNSVQIRPTFLAAADDEVAAAGAKSASIIVGCFVSVGALVALVAIVARGRRPPGRQPLFVQQLDAVTVEPGAKESALAAPQATPQAAQI